MIDLTYLILLVLLLVYVPLYIHVRMSKRMKDRGIVPYGPFIMIKTKRGIQFLDRISKNKKLWAVFGTVSKVIAAVLMASILVIMIINLTLLPLMMNTPGMGVEYALAIPGLNPMLPLVYGVIGLIVAIIVHEVAHGIQTRANDMTVESVGVLYAVVPVGAFVEPNEEQIKNCGRKARSSVFAAGIAINFIMAFVLFILMSAGLMGTMSSPFSDNAAVVNAASGSPADDSDIGYSGVILGFTDGSNETYLTYEELKGYDFHTTGYRLIYASPNGPDLTTDPVYMGVYITGTASGSPAAGSTLPAKNYFITAIDGQPITSFNSFYQIMSSFAPGQTVDVDYLTYAGGALASTVQTAANITLGENSGRAYLGVYYTLSGFTLTMPGQILEAAKNPLYGKESVTDMALSAIGYIGAPMRGYSPIPQELTWWYDSSILPDEIFWPLLQTVFWIFWLNLVLGVTNALPAVPFDGGYLFMDGVGYVVDRTRRNDSPEKREKITNTITSFVSYAMIFVLFAVMIAVLF